MFRFCNFDFTTSSQKFNERCKVMYLRLGENAISRNDCRGVQVSEKVVNG